MTPALEMRRKCPRLWHLTDAGEERWRMLEGGHRLSPAGEGPGSVHSRTDCLNDSI